MLCRPVAPEIDARRAVEATIDQNSQYFQTILDVFPDPLMVINRDYSIAFANSGRNRCS